MKTYIYIFFLFVISITISARQTKESYANIDSLEIQSKSSDSIVMRFLTDSGVKITIDNKIKLLKNGKEKFEDLFSEIAQAKDHVHLEYFNFRNDSIANSLFDLLAIKAKEGVEIRAIFDAFGNWSNSRPLKKKHLKAIRQRGIQITHFDPFKFPYINHALHRDHRKIAIVDGKVGYTGGMNIANYYIKGLPEIGAWRDMHIRIEGSAVKDLQQIFLTMWNKTTHEKIKGDKYFPPLYNDTLIKGNKTVAIVDRVPRKSPKLIRHTYAKSIMEATKNIQIVSPYFIPTHSIKKAIKKALKKGVEVEIMISSKADIPFTPEGSAYIAHSLMKRGAKVYFYNGGFHHSKIMMIDGLFCTVGTTNLNSRSLRYDYEVNAFIFDKDITTELSEIFEADKNNSIQLTPKEWKKRSIWNRFVGWFATLFTPVL